MAKIGRNDPCPCGSGLKYKKCCLPQEAEQRAVVAASAGGNPEYRPVIRQGVEMIQQAASEKRQEIGTLGVLLLFSTTAGDAWMLEITGGDALQLSDQGLPLQVGIEENPETTEVEWGHTYELRQGQFVVTSYQDKNEKIYEGYPVAELEKAVAAIRQGMPEGLADMVHV